MVYGIGDLAPSRHLEGGAQPALSIVIPVYNEELRLPSLFETLATAAPGVVEGAGMRLLEALAVDDGSSDRTAAMLQAASERNPLLRPVLEFDRNRGKGAAFATGVERARGDYVLLADIDLSTPLDELGKLAAALRDGADIAIGSRAVPGAIVKRGPLHRKVLGKAFNRAVRLLTGLEVRDTQNGFKLFPTAALKRLVAEQTCAGFAFDVELLMQANMAGMHIAEVPVIYVHDPRSSIEPVSESYRMLKDVSVIAYRLRKRSAHRWRARGPLVDLPADDPD
jgi:dolichyl-phosphate beta-glucosyltransferase